ncbi:hypothetical protein [Bacillus sp. 196mf]|uniref:hypothetical protein n=1 Tax=Bacillus sp. 196mf TaxID=1761754 RepID=UPI000D7C7383|nr:hypothetical protein [Bacillus sp. 196mf]PYE87817.1 hypothetical protein ATL10_10599 [Bacillus sp. 196mf]
MKRKTKILKAAILTVGCITCLGPPSSSFAATNDVIQPQEVKLTANNPVSWSHFAGATSLDGLLDVNVKIEEKKLKIVSSIKNVTTQPPFGVFF